MLIVFEGIDGCGKTTQTNHLAAWLTEQGREVFIARDPGTSPAGLAIREVLLHKDVTLQPLTQMLLFSAARSELACELAKKLQSGVDVVCDRWLLSTLVYQHHVQGVDRKLVEDTAVAVNYGIEPDLYIVLDVDVIQTMRRKEQLPSDLGCCSAPNACRTTEAPSSMAAGPGQRDRFEREPADFRERLRDGYLAEATEPRGRQIEVLAGNYCTAVMHDMVLEACARRIPEFATLYQAVLAVPAGG